MMTKFLLAVDIDVPELFILHRQFPACLIRLVQTVPVTFQIVDLYDEISNEALLKHPFLEEAKAFWRDKDQKAFNTN